ncbi:UNVERIFIED_ORG: hypothetical protein ABIC48_004210 [Burkholderia territorii]
MELRNRARWKRAQESAVERIEKTARERRHVIFETDVVTRRHQRERLQQAFDVRIVRMLAGDRQPSGYFGKALSKRLHRMAQQRHLAFEVRQQILGFDGHTRSVRRCMCGWRCSVQ